MSYYDWPETNSVTSSPVYGGDSQNMYDYYEIAL